MLNNDKEFLLSIQVCNGSIARNKKYRSEELHLTQEPETQKEVAELQPSSCQRFWGAVLGSGFRSAANSGI
jgi:hypothetical protein